MEVCFFTSSAGENYVGNYIYSLPDKKAVKKIERRLELIEKYGFNFRTYSGTMTKLHGYNLYEIKIDFNHMFYRILCVFRGAECWLLNMFAKKENKTPLQEIRTALQRAKELDTMLALVIS